MPPGGFEPPPTEVDQPLKLARLPFHHGGIGKCGWSRTSSDRFWRPGQRPRLTLVVAGSGFHPHLPWHPRKESNPRRPVPKTGALSSELRRHGPLGGICTHDLQLRKLLLSLLSYKGLVRAEGIEPPASGVRTRYSTQLSYARKELVGLRGIEPLPVFTRTDF